MSSTSHVPKTTEEAAAAMSPGEAVSAVSDAFQDGLKRERRRGELHTRVDSDFMYHPATPNQQVRYQELRSRARGLAHAIVELVPPGREQSSALTRLEEAVMHANAGIARHG